MHLDSKSLDVKLVNTESEDTFEMWWFLNENEILALSHCPQNSPTTVIHTMILKESLKQLSQLVKEGWSFVECSFDYQKHLGKRLYSKLQQ
jgi:hypothetical protein